MARIHHPHTFLLAYLPDVQTAARSHKLLEYLGEMAGVQWHKSHPVQDALVHTLHDLVTDLPVRLVPPPGQHIRLC